jgi:hypothetical protein
MSNKTYPTDPATTLKPVVTIKTKKPNGFFQDPGYHIVDKFLSAALARNAYTTFEFQDSHTLPGAVGVCVVGAVLTAQESHELTAAGLEVWGPVRD